MQENLLTKCPHCGTTFRLTKSQLDIAGGAVRCGSCYQVFHAAEHIVKTSVVEERRTVTKAPDPIEEAFDMKSDKGMDPYDTKDLDMDADDSDLFSEEYRATMDAESNPDDFGYPERKSDPKSNTIVDESWAEALLKELGEEGLEEDDDESAFEDDGAESQTGLISGGHAFDLDEEPIRKPPKPNKGNELSDTFKNLGTFAGDDPFAMGEDDETGFSDSESNTDESWAKAMLNELEDEDAPKKPDTSHLSLISDAEPEDNSPFAAKELSNNRDEIIARLKQNKIREQELARASGKAKKKSALRSEETEDFFRLLDDEPAPHRSETLIDDGMLDDLSDFENEAITPEHLFADSEDLVNQQVHISSRDYSHEEPRGLSTGTKTTLGCILLLILLAAQYCYFQFDEMARSPSLRPALEKMCGIIGCQLPGQHDISKIAGTNLVVRSHPYEKNALVIDVIIKNQASFEQPYPIVQLNFEDINGNPVASRRFEPEEYIGDKMLPLNSMPRNTPVHLTMEIKDPGRNAVNYQLLFLPKNSAE